MHLLVLLYAVNRTVNPVQGRNGLQSCNFEKWYRGGPIENTQSSHKSALSLLRLDLVIAFTQIDFCPRL